MAAEETSTLLRLPAELRNEIFTYALAESTLDIDRQYHDGGSHLPGLSLACKQTLLETKAMYYTSANITSKDVWILGKWLHRLSTLPSEHPHRFMKTIYLDCRNRSEQSLPLRLGQRFALSHHSALKLGGLMKRLEILNETCETPFVVMTCVVSPSQELVWTYHPFALCEMLERRWNEVPQNRKRAVTMEEWAPCGTEGLFWKR